MKQWKKSKPDVRQRMKSLQLGINYGMGVPSLAKGLDRHPLIASTIIELHKRKYPRFWEWRANMVQQAMLDRKMETVFGWPLYISNTPNKRTLYNFPMQGNGAEMLRLAACGLCEAGIVPNMLIHDGILLEVRNKEEIAAAVEIMKAAGRDVCDGFEIGVDVDQLLEHGARYRDKRPVAKKMWDVRSCSRWRRSGLSRRTMGFVVRHGRRIEVETLETGAPPARRKRAPAKETFARIPHDRGMKLYGQIDGAAWIILLELDRLIFKAYGRNPVRLTNPSLEAVGIAATQNERHYANLKTPVSSRWRDKV